MQIRRLTTAEDLARYERWVTLHSEGSVWQSLAWKRYQEALGRRVLLYAAEEGDGFATTALVVVDRTVGGLATWEIPRGPLGPSGNGHATVADTFLETIIADARGDGTLALYLSPSKAFPFLHSSFSISSRRIYPEATIFIDLRRREEEILAAMHPKGRYNIKVAERHGVRVERSDDVGAFHHLARQTGRRDGFTILPQHHYEAFLQALHGSFLFLARSKSGEPLAGLLGASWNGTGTYYYGASSRAHRELMAPYALQWEAMRFCKAQGSDRYDLFGIAPPGAGSGHPWHGVTDFKRKFGGVVATFPPERVAILRPVLHALLRWKRRVLG